MSKVLVVPASLCLLLLLVAGQLGCAAQRQLMPQRESDETEGWEEQEAPVVESVADALLLIMGATDARRDAVSVSRLARHPDPAVRSAALRALGLIGDPRSLPAMSAGLEDPDLRVRVMSAFALSQHWAWPLTELQARTMSASIEQLLMQAIDAEIDSYGIESPALAGYIRALAEFGGVDPAVHTLLWTLLRLEELPRRARSEALRSLAVQGRGGRGSSLNSQRLRTLAATYSRDPGLSWRLSYLLAYSDFDEDALESATVLLEEFITALPSTLEHCWALRALGKVASRRSITTLETTLREPMSNPGARLCAVRGAHSSAAAGGELLVIGLADPSRDVAVEAARGLGSRGEFGYLALSTWLSAEERAAGPLAVSRLQALAVLLKKNRSETPSWLVAALPRMLEELRLALQSGDSQLRGAAYALGSSHPSPDASQLLLARVGHEQHKGALIELALAVASRPEEQLEGSLLDWLTGPDPVLGAIAAEGLGTRPGTHVTEQLLSAFARFSGSEQVERRQAIVAAMKTMDTTTDEDRASFLSDPEAQVRMEAYAGFPGSDPDLLVPGPPQERDIPASDAALFGANRFRTASIETSRGTIQVALLPDLAPSAVSNFALLATQGFYDGVLFHRVVPDFVVQAGDPTGSGWGGPGYSIRDEFSPTPFGRGTLGMARSGKDTAGSQWFITHSPQPHLDGHYTVFGQVIDGWRVLDSIQQGDLILGVSITPQDEKKPASR